MTRDEALALAESIRAVRVDMVERIASGTIELRDVLESGDPRVTMIKVVAILESLPGLGKVSARRILEEEKIPSDCKIRELGEHRTKSLLERVEARES